MTDGLTKEQRKGIAEADIERLEKQRDVLKETVTKMGNQIDQLYAERSREAQGNEKARLEISEGQKKLLQFKEVIKIEQGILAKKELAFTDKSVKERDAIKQLRFEIKTEREQSALDKLEADKKLESALKRLEEADDRELRLKTQEREVSDLEKTAVLKERKAAQTINDAESFGVGLKIKMQAQDKILSDLARKRQEFEAFRKTEESRLSEKEKTLSQERENFTKAVKEKEYQLSKQAQNVKNRELDLEARQKEFEVHVAKSQGQEESEPEALKKKKK